MAWGGLSDPDSAPGSMFCLLPFQSSEGYFILRFAGCCAVVGDPVWVPSSTDVLRESFLWGSSAKIRGACYEDVGTGQSAHPLSLGIYFFSFPTALY